MKRVTLAEVARKAGVSVQTASHVMAENMSVRLPDSTRERVRKAAEELSYQPNRIARAMKTGKTNMLTLWMPVDRPNLGYLRMLDGVSRVTRSSGKDLMVVGLPSDVAYGLDPKLPYQWPVDGILAFDCGRAIRRFWEDPQSRQFALVNLGLEHLDGADTITWDVKGGVKKVTESLIAEGRRKIIHLTPHWVLRDYPYEQRRSGYALAMLEAGFQPEFLGTESESAGAGEAALAQYLRDHEAPEAIICFQDAIAIGAYRHIVAHGISVPDECAIWGYGNVPEVADYPIPTLSAPYDLLSREGVQLLLERSLDPKRPEVRLNYDLEVFTPESRAFAAESE